LLARVRLCFAVARCSYRRTLVESPTGRHSLRRRDPRRGGAPRFACGDESASAREPIDTRCLATHGQVVERLAARDANVLGTVELLHREELRHRESSIGKPDLGDPIHG